MSDQSKRMDLPPVPDMVQQHLNEARAKIVELKARMGLAGVGWALVGEALLAIVRAVEALKPRL